MEFLYGCNIDVSIVFLLEDKIVVWLIREWILGERCGWGRWERNNGRRVVVEVRREVGRGLNKDVGVVDGVERKVLVFFWMVCLVFLMGRVGLGVLFRWFVDRRMLW